MYYLHTSLFKKMFVLTITLNIDIKLPTEGAVNSVGMFSKSRENRPSSKYDLIIS